MCLSVSFFFSFEFGCPGWKVASGSWGRGFLLICLIHLFFSPLLNVESTREKKMTWVRLKILPGRLRLALARYMKITSRGLSDDDSTPLRVGHIYYCSEKEPGAFIFVHQRHAVHSVGWWHFVPLLFELSTFIFSVFSLLGLFFFLLFFFSSACLFFIWKGRMMRFVGWTYAAYCVPGLIHAERLFLIKWNFKWNPSALSNFWVISSARTLVRLCEGVVYVVCNMRTNSPHFAFLIRHKYLRLMGGSAMASVYWLWGPPLATTLLLQVPA